MYVLAAGRTGRGAHDAEQMSRLNACVPFGQNVTSFAFVSLDEVILTEHCDHPSWSARRYLRIWWIMSPLSLLVCCMAEACQAYKAIKKPLTLSPDS